MTARLQIHVQNVLRKDLTGEALEEYALGVRPTVGGMESFGDDPVITDQDCPDQSTIADPAPPKRCERETAMHEGGIGSHVAHGKIIEDAQK